jgi:thiamine-phosphate pyrophosphorylase
MIHFRLLLVTDRHSCRESLGDVLARLAAALPPGALAVELREKDLSGLALYELALDLKRVLDPQGVPILVNDRLDVAMAAGCAGVHLPESGLDPADVRAVFPGLIGRSTHSVETAAALDPACVDYATFGPVFDTPSKRAYGPPQGVGRLREAVAASRVPLFAIGGIGPGTAPELVGTGFRGIAAISAILGSADPVGAALGLSDRCPK